MFGKVDAAILDAIKRGRSPYVVEAYAEATAVSHVRGCDAWRIVDRRLQALRKQGVIRYERGKGGGWRIAEKVEGAPQ